MTRDDVHNSWLAGLAFVSTQELENILAASDEEIVVMLCAGMNEMCADFRATIREILDARKAGTV